MGTIIPLPIEPEPTPVGDPCYKCWGIGKPLGDGDTPLTVTITISDVVKGPGWIAGDGEPLNGDFVLTQHPTEACYFRYVDVPVLITWSNLTSQSVFFVRNDASKTTFYGFGAQCALYASNTLTDKFTGGSVLVTLPGVE